MGATSTLIFLVKWSVIFFAITYSLLYWRVYENADAFTIEDRVTLIVIDILSYFSNPFGTTSYEDVIKAKNRLNSMMELANDNNKDNYSQSIDKIIDFALPLQDSPSENARLKDEIKKTLSKKNDKLEITQLNGEGLKVRYYQSKERKEDSPAIIFIHGGGWVLGTIGVYDLFCRSVAATTNYPIISVEYRTAPENKFPAAVDDSYYFAKWVHDHSDIFSIDNQKLVVLGDSAGGNLAAVLSILSNQRKDNLFAYQYLVYPVTDYFDLNNPSYSTMGSKGYFLGSEMMVWFFNQYLNNESEANDWKVSPLRADLSLLRDLPPASVILAELDPLNHEGFSYAEKLKEAGVEVSVTRYRSYHGFMNVVDKTLATKQLLDELANTLHKFFDK